MATYGLRRRTGLRLPRLASAAGGPPRPPDLPPLLPRIPSNPAGPPRPPDRGPVVMQPPRPAAPGAPGAAPGTPDYLGQARDQVSAMLDPMLRLITQRANAQASALSSAFGNVTNQYASFLGNAAGNVSSMFNEAKGPVSRAASAINGQLTQIGAHAAQTEQQAAAQAGLPKGGAQSPDINLKQEGKGAGGAAGAIGQAMIDALTAEQNAAMKYAEGLPGFAQLQGQYETQKGLIQIAAAMADQLAQTTAQAPQLLYSIYNDLLDRAQHDKEFAFQVRQYNDQQAQRRAGIVGMNAPTNAGRQAYWQQQADRRTASSGYQWVGTSSGIRPLDADPKKPGIQPVVTLQGQAASKVGAPPTRSTPRGLAVWDPATQTWVVQPGTGKPPGATKPSNTGPYYQNPMTHTWELKPGYRPGPNGTIIKAPTTGSTKQPTNTGPWYHNPKTKTWELKPGYKVGPGGKVVADTPAAKPTGTAPRRVAPGKWVDRNGRPLTPAQNRVWEQKWKRGETDGHGKVKPPSTGTGGTVDWNPGG